MHWEITAGRIQGTLQDLGFQSGRKERLTVYTIGRREEQETTERKRHKNDRINQSIEAKRSEKTKVITYHTGIDVGVVKASNQTSNITSPAALLPSI